MAAKDNTLASEIDKTSFFWTGKCGACHPGGGPGEADRDGELYWDEQTGQFGYEKLGKTAADVVLDGDYAFVNPSTGGLAPAAWDTTGVSEADCMLCHRKWHSVDPNNGMNLNALWRQATLRALGSLKDSAGNPAPAFAMAPTASMGWHSEFTLASLPAGKPPQAATLQIDYEKGLGSRELYEVAGSLVMRGKAIEYTPNDMSCWGCHAFPDLKKRGRVWFDPDQDVHYAFFNGLSGQTGEIGSMDKAGMHSQACTVCHPAEEDHNFAKGNALVGSVQNETDYLNFRTCEDCHSDGPEKHPDAPLPTSSIHSHFSHGFYLSCQTCHVPYKTAPAQLVVDNSATGSPIGYDSPEFLSADPQDPSNPDRSKWYPDLEWKKHEDGFNRLFPAKTLLTVWWGDWDDGGTPGVYGDDVIAPLILWRVRQITGGVPLAGVDDDNGDGKPEVNRLDEIALYLTALKGVDSYGVQVAANPVLIKGGYIYYEDVGAPSGVGKLEIHGTGIHVESAASFSLDHNVLKKEQALGAGSDCGACHRAFNFGFDTDVFDRLVPVDPFDTSGQPVYRTIRELTGLNPW